MAGIGKLGAAIRPAAVVPATTRKLRRVWRFVDAFILIPRTIRPTQSLSRYGPYPQSQRDDRPRHAPPALRQGGGRGRRRRRGTQPYRPDRRRQSNITHKPADFYGAARFLSGRWRSRYRSRRVTIDRN